ncbi:MAG: FGGY-family carbohydrate kinase [Acidimicrobiales bacterium]|jgi:xylulokinase
MTNEDLCLSIDLGTGGPKVGLVTLEGELVAYEIHHVPTVFTGDGGAVQDAELWWTIICDAAKRLLAKPAIEVRRIRAVAVTGQYASTVPVDANGLPTGPCLTWLDTRGVPYSRQAVGGKVQGYNPRKALHFIRKSAGAPSTSGGDPIGQILYLNAREPDLVSRTRWFMEPVDYLTMRFTGVASATHASRFAMWMTDTRQLSHYEYDAALLGAVGLTSERLPPLLPFGEVVGTITHDVAANLGLSKDTVVITGVPDFHAAALGSGATELFATHLALSTSSWISCPFPKKKTDVLHSIASVPGLTNDSYLVINNQETGARALEWFQGVLAGAGLKMGYEQLTALAETSPPGARGVIFTPWLAGERSPIDDKSARAGFTNLSATSTTSDLIRAVLEGVAANSAWLFSYVEKFAGTTLSPIRLLGGGAQSSLWCQIFADTLGRDVEQVREPLVAQLRGAALLAAISLGQMNLGDVSSRVARGTPYQPLPENVESYQERRNQLPSLFARDKSWRRETRSSSR